MTPLLTYQAVERKLATQRSILIGNYEFYYTAGKYKALHPELAINETLRPEALKNVIMGSLEGQDFEPADTPEKYMCKILHRYRPNIELYDEQMEKLFIWGETGKDPFHE